MGEHYDIIIIGTGAGGGTLAHALALAGKKLLVLERGTFLPREKENWDTTAVFLKNRYHTTETWTDHNGKTLHPGTGYWVGGNTKVFGAAIAVTGIILAKLDGTAKGGVVMAIKEQLNIPVKFVGLGETPQDIETFDPGRFVDALFGGENPK